MSNKSYLVIVGMNESARLYPTPLTALCAWVKGQSVAPASCRIIADSPEHGNLFLTWCRNNLARVRAELYKQQVYEVTWLMEHLDTATCSRREVEPFTCG